MKINKNIYIINGSYFCEPMMGVQRFAYETVNELDKLMSEKFNLSNDEKTENKKTENKKTEDKKTGAASKGIKLILCIPNCELETEIPRFNYIEVIREGKHTGKRFEQFELPKILRRYKALGINLCNSLPFTYPYGIACIHDIAFKTHPEFFTEKGDNREMAFRKLLYKRAFDKCDAILTVSEFARKEILDNYKVKGHISVTCNGWQHYRSDDMDNSIIEKIGQFPEYYFYMASLSKNKNINWILDNARFNPDKYYVLSGRMLGEDANLKALPNVIYLGYVTDAEARALMHNCKAFLFPSIYEGFGIPPMEAMCMGARIVVGDIEVMHEIYGDSAVYVDTADAKVKIDDLMLAWDKTHANSDYKNEVLKVLDRYSWKKSAECLLEEVCRVSAGDRSQ